MQAGNAAASGAAGLLVADDQLGDYTALPGDGSAAGLQLPVASIPRLTGQLLEAYQQVRTTSSPYLSML